MVSAEDHKHRNTLTLIATSSLASGPLLKYRYQETLENKYLQSIPQDAEEEAVGGSWEAKAAVFNYSLGRDLGCCKSPDQCLRLCICIWHSSKRRETDVQWI